MPGLRHIISVVAKLVLTSPLVGLVMINGDNEEKS
jgi:hypothetical protein